MSTSLEDKLLYGKAAGYCSSSDDEAVDESNAVSNATTKSTPSSDAKTGPKGVLADWRRYKQLQSENNARDAKEMIALAKRLSMTCRTATDDDRARIDAEQQPKDHDDDDAFLNRYMQQRRMELLAKQQSTSAIPANQLITLTTSQSFLDAIDESKQRTVVIHIYDDGIDECESVDGCLQCLAATHRSVRFYRIRSTTLKMSERFGREALPTIQVYRDDKLIGNFVRIGDYLRSDEIYADELEAFLQKLGIFDNTTKHIRDADDGGDGGDEFD